MNKLWILLHKNLSFREVTLCFFIIGGVEIIFRLIWHLTPLTFLFAGFTVFMYLNLKTGDKPVSVKKWWFLFLPFLFFVGVFFAIMSSGWGSLDNINRWMNWATIGYIIITPAYLLPVLIGIQKSHYFGEIQLKILLLHFVSILQLISLLVRFYLFLYSRPSGIFDINLLDSYSLNTFLAIIVLLNLYYFVSNRRKDESSMTAKMEEYKTDIIDLFENKKIYLIKDLTINLLSLEAKIDKKELEVFFNQYIGQDFQTFVAQYRISHALELINDKGSQYTLEYIATQSGYRNRTSFTKYFKELVGVLPSEYINRIKNQQTCSSPFES